MEEKLGKEKLKCIIQFSLRSGTQYETPPPFLEMEIKKGVRVEELHDLFENLFTIINELINEALSERERIELVLQKYGIEKFAEKSD